MKIKRRSKKPGLKLRKRPKSKPSLSIRKQLPKKRYTKGGSFIIEDKPWDERFVPCCDCLHWLKSMKMYIGKDGEQGWICPIKNKPRIHNEFVICKDYDDRFVVIQRAGSGFETVDRQKLQIKRRRKKPIDRQKLEIKRRRKKQ